MRAALAVLPLALLSVASAARAERLTIALSAANVAINSNFTGTQLTVFGVVESDQAAANTTPAGEYGVAVLLTGPRESVVVRRKDRVLGVWANRGAKTVLAPPTFYALHTSAATATLAKAPVLERLQLGFDNIPFLTLGERVDDPEVAEFRQAFIRLKREERLYSESADVGFLGKIVFRTTIPLPANIAVGTYTAAAYVFAGGELVAHAGDTVNVLQTGVEQTLTQFSRSQGLAYGIICVLLAVFVGWLGGVIFRRD